MLHESLIRASFPGGFIHELYYKSEISSHKKWTILNIPNSAIHGRGNVNRDRCPCSGLVEPSCGDPFTSRADQDEAGTSRPWASSLCRLRCARPDLWRRSPSDKGHEG